MNVCLGVHVYLYMSDGLLEPQFLICFCACAFELYMYSPQRDIGLSK